MFLVSSSEVAPAFGQVAYNPCCQQTHASVSYTISIRLEPTCACFAPLLEQVLERQQVRTPGASTVIDLETTPSLGPAQGSNPSAAAAAAATGARASRPNSSNGAAAIAAAGASGASAPVTVVQHSMAALEALVPTLEGDLSAANVAVVRSLGSGAAAPPGSNAAGIGPGTLHVDEVLRAENAFLDVCDVREVSERLKAQAEARAERCEGGPIGRDDQGLGEELG